MINDIQGSKIYLMEYVQAQGKLLELLHIGYWPEDYAVCGRGGYTCNPVNKVINFSNRIKRKFIQNVLSLTSGNDGRWKGTENDNTEEGSLTMLNRIAFKKKVSLTIKCLWIHQ